MMSTRDKNYKRSLQAEEWSLDKMPKKTVKKWKKKDRQRGKSIIKKELKDG